MKERLTQLLDQEQLTPSRFADLIGVQRSSVSHVLSGRNNPSYDFLQKTLKTFPGLNAQWLMLGKGSMYEESFQESASAAVSASAGQMGTLFPADEVIGEKARSGREEEERARYQRAEKEKERFPAASDITADKGLPEDPDSAEEKGSASTDAHSTERRLVRVLLFYDDHTVSSYTPSD